MIAPAPVVFHGQIESGRMMWGDKPGLHERLKQLEGMHVIVSIEPARSLNLNEWYWGVLLECAAEYTGDDPKALHREMKQRFLRPDAKGRYTTRHLTQRQFQDYVDRCTVLLMYYGVSIRPFVPARAEESHGSLEQLETAAG